MILDFALHHGDVLRFRSDLLLLKYAQARWGIDEQVARILHEGELVSEEALRPGEGDSVVVDTRGAIGSPRAMFVGTPPIGSLTYDQIHAFGRDAIKGLERHGLRVAHLTTTIHGVGFGLDAGESAQSLTLGFLEGLRTCSVAPLSRITLADRDERTIRVIAAALAQIGIMVAVEGAHDADAERHPIFVAPASAPHTERPAGLGPHSAAKEHVFVAIPYAPEFQDVYEFGIYAPIRDCGFICEKVDEASFTGDILARIRDRIRSAKFVVADLTGSRPNVYLEVGYAWGCGVPVLFLAREGETLHFDVKTHRCIFYRTIGQLGRDLTRLVHGLYMLSEAPKPVSIVRHGKITPDLGRFTSMRMVGPVGIVDVEDMLGAEGGEELRATVDTLLGNGCKAIVLNLAKVRYTDSTGLGTIVAALSKVSRSGGALKVAVSDELRKLFLVTKLSGVLETYQDEEEAIRSFQLAFPPAPFPSVRPKTKK